MRSKEMEKLVAELNPLVVELGIIREETDQATKDLKLLAWDIEGLDDPQYPTERAKALVMDLWAIHHRILKVETKLKANPGTREKVCLPSNSSASPPPSRSSLSSARE